MKGAPLGCHAEPISHKTPTGSHPTTRRKRLGKRLHPHLPPPTGANPSPSNFGDDSIKACAIFGPHLPSFHGQFHIENALCFTVRIPMDSCGRSTIDPNTVHTHPKSIPTHRSRHNNDTHRASKEPHRQTTSTYAYDTSQKGTTPSGNMATTYSYDASTIHKNVHDKSLCKPRGSSHPSPYRPNPRSTKKTPATPKDIPKDGKRRLRLQRAKAKDPSPATTRQKQPERLIHKQQVRL